jgi:hypothetical protein
VNFHARLIWVHADLMNDMTAIAAYLVVIVALALFVGWEYERSRRLHSGRYSFFDRSDNDPE